MEFSGQNTGVGSDLPNPGIEPRSPTLQVDSLSTEPQGKPMLLQNFKKHYGLCVSLQGLPQHNAIDWMA